jgi:hypothetical protein
MRIKSMEPTRPARFGHLIRYCACAGRASHLGAVGQPEEGIAGNGLEALRCNWRGFHSIRVNEQRCVGFRWAEGGAHDVRVCDYRKG